MYSEQILSFHSIVNVQNEDALTKHSWNYMCILYDIKISHQNRQKNQMNNLINTYTTYWKVYEITYISA